jgi:hypothetical protein
MEPRYELDLCSRCCDDNDAKLYVDDCCFGSLNDWAIILKHEDNPLLLYNLYKESPYYGALAFVDDTFIWNNNEFDCRRVIDDYADLHQRCKAGTTVTELWHRICKERDLYMDSPD